MPTNIGEGLAEDPQQSEPHWYVLRDLSRPHAKCPAYTLLKEENVEVFTPLQERVRVVGGRRVRVAVPVMIDLLFVYGNRASLNPLVEKIKNLQYRYKKGAQRAPMTVSDIVMERFVTFVNSNRKVRYYQPGEITPEMYGRRVRVAMSGIEEFEGRLLYVRGSGKKRLIVELDGILAATVEIDNDIIEMLD